MEKFCQSVTKKCWKWPWDQLQTASDKTDESDHRSPLSQENNGMRRPICTQYKTPIFRNCCPLNNYIQTKSSTQLSSIFHLIIVTPQILPDFLFYGSSFKLPPHLHFITLTISIILYFIFSFIISFFFQWVLCFVVYKWAEYIIVHRLLLYMIAYATNSSSLCFV